MSKLALYFGYGSGGHFLRGVPGPYSYSSTIDPQCDVPGFPWRIGLLDTGLLKNGKIPDLPDGRVWWAFGNSIAVDTGFAVEPWYAFFWWDRSGDSRPGSNSGFYVRGFPWGASERREAFTFACAAWPKIVERQLFPLRLTEQGERP